MINATFVFTMVFTGGVCLWGMLHKPATRQTKKKYEGIKDLPAWHKNVSTRWQ